MGDLYHQLSRTNGRDDVLTECFLLDLVGELLGCLVVHIGLQQSFPDVLYSLRDIDLGNPSLTFEDLK